MIMNQRESVRTIVEQLHGVTDELVVEAFRERLKRDGPLLREEGVSDHFCSMFVPYVVTTQSVFVGHHKKSGLWMPPGGHIDIGEAPIEAARREITEELRIHEPQQLSPLALTYVDITNRPDCTRHYDIWFRMTCADETPFDYERNEFYEAGWYPIEQAMRKSSRSMFTRVLMQLKTSQDVRGKQV